MQTILNAIAAAAWIVGEEQNPICRELQRRGAGK
jgi:hypothetical protein